MGNSNCQRSATLPQSKWTNNIVDNVVDKNARQTNMFAQKLTVFVNFSTLESDFSYKFLCDVDISIRLLTICSKSLIKSINFSFCWIKAAYELQATIIDTSTANEFVESYMSSALIVYSNEQTTDNVATQNVKIFWIKLISTLCKHLIGMKPEIFKSLRVLNNIFILTPFFFYQVFGMIFTFHWQ